LPFQEEIQKKTGYIVRQEDGTFHVDANTSIDQLSEELGIKIPEVLLLYSYYACLGLSTVAMFALRHKNVYFGCWTWEVNWSLVCNLHVRIDCIHRM